MSIICVFEHQNLKGDAFDFVFLLIDNIWAFLYKKEKENAEANDQFI